jgi:hypothetical protein
VNPGAFRKELEAVINRHSRENGSNTPDFILAEFLIGCLVSFDRATRSRTEWYAPLPNAAPAPARTPPTTLTDEDVTPPDGTPRRRLPP